ncbi:hypothetical protein Tco_0254822, partial [Tanacetum coccineum]
LSAGQQKAKKALQYLVQKLNTSPYPAVVLKSFGCDHILPTMALDSTKFQCIVIIKALLPYDATMTEYQLANIFTKALCRERIEFLIDKLGMRSFTPETLKELANEAEE